MHHENMQTPSNWDLNQGLFADIDYCLTLILDYFYVLYI